MSQIVYRANLSAKSFPFLSDFQGRSVIIPGPDNTYNRAVTSSTDSDGDVGIPLLYYCHNVLPAPYGFQSVGYGVGFAGLTGHTDFSDIHIIRCNAISATQAGQRLYFSPMPSGTHYTLQTSGWTAVTGSTPYTSGTQVSYAEVQGITYIFFEKIGCYKYNYGTNALIAVTLTGLTVTNILGIASVQGYMIAWDESSIYWCSTVDINYVTNSVDFIPSLITGAGNLKPEGAHATIKNVVPSIYGMTIYTTSNIVTGIYSGNVRYPFNFRELTSSGGCEHRNLIAYDAISGNQYAYTTSGLQMVSATATQTVFPDVTDFLAGKVFEDFSETSLIFTQQNAGANGMVKQLTSIADRYLIFSYGLTSFTHALVYDMIQKRWGKLKITHVTCVEVEPIATELLDLPRHSIAFMSENGTLTVMNPDVDLANSNGVFVLGKFQYARSRLLTLETVLVQSVHPEQSLTIYNLTTPDGGTLDEAVINEGANVSLSSSRQRTYNFHTTSQNHTLLIQGGIALSSLVLKFHIAGRR